MWQSNSYRSCTPPPSPSEWSLAIRSCVGTSCVFFHHQKISTASRAGGIQKPEDFTWEALRVWRAWSIVRSLKKKIRGASLGQKLREKDHCEKGMHITPCRIIRWLEESLRSSGKENARPLCRRKEVPLSEREARSDGR